MIFPHVWTDLLRSGDFTPGPCPDSALPWSVFEKWEQAHSVIEWDAAFPSPADTFTYLFVAVGLAEIESIKPIKKPRGRRAKAR